MVGQRVQDPRGDDHELSPASAAGEPDRVVALAEVGVARTAARAAHAADVPLAHDPLPRLEADDAFAERVDHAAPLVPGDDREAHPARIERPGEDVDVRTADTGKDASNANLARPRGRRLDVPQLHGVGPVDDDRAHGD